MNDIVLEQFTAGVNAYWSGEEAEGWDNPEVRERSPYVTGWYMASMWEVQPGFIIDEDGEPLQVDDDYDEDFDEDED